MITHWFPYLYLRRRYDCHPLTALLLASCTALAWLFLRLESPAWQRLIEQRQRWYPHLASKVPSAGDPLRIALQSLWLLVFRPWPQARRRTAPQWMHRVGDSNHRLWSRIGVFLSGLPEHARESKAVQDGAQWWRNLRPRQQHWLNYSCAAVALILLVVCITEPFNYLSQSVFVILLWVVAMVIRRVPGRFPTLLLIMLSLIVSCRYLWWRYTATLNWDSPLDLACGVLLLIAETYSWLVLVFGYIQTCWPLNRPPAQLPRDTELWPTVDLLIATYNEDLSIVRGTVYAALGIDWPREKLRISILDDGNREEFRLFAEQAGVNYITRSDNRHAKAGNLNQALKQLDGELVAIFDCDHVPVRSFLQLTVGWFLRDPKLALVQTPHHFLSPDPFERNLDTFRHQPNEGELFYGLVQDGNDMWNAAFFCGSCAVLRRSALDDIGGFAVETVTEDAHTALRLHRKGWNSAYVRIPQAAGLATESLSAHIGQRIRWARGMAQIFRTDNPLLGKGLTFFQRICYANAMLHFLAGLPRLVFLTAPLAFLLLHAYIIYAPALMIILYVIPHMVHASLTNSRMQGEYRLTFWGEVYETVLAWYIARPTTVALFNPKKGKFNVTAKGGLMAEDQFDWGIAKPYLVLALLNIVGLGFAVWRLIYGPATEIGTTLVSSLWVIYNLLIVGAAVAVAAEVHQVRKSHRVQAKLPAAVRLQNGRFYPCMLVDYSESGTGVELDVELSLPIGERVFLMMQRGEREFLFSGIISRSHKNFIAIALNELSSQQKIDYVQCTFSRADAWLNWNENFEPDRPLHSFIDVLRLGASGYYRLYQYLPAWTRYLARPVMRLLAWLISYVPRFAKAAPFFFYISIGMRPMSRYFNFTLVSLLSLAMSCAQAQPIKEQTAKVQPPVTTPASDSAAVSNVPGWDVSRSFEDLGRLTDSLLLGTHNTDQFEFTMRRDRIASDAKLQLEYTPSPGLLPTLSHLRVYLNDELMSVITIDKEQLGKKTVRQVDLDPRLISDFNRVRLEFVGHYTDICEEPSNSALWVNISRASLVSLKEQALIVQNDLAYFPTPFFDARDYDKPVLNMVFAASPTLGEQRAAGILASYFGSQAAWRGTKLPVLFDQLPAATPAKPITASIVFATNTHRPAFLSDLKQFPPVEAPVVQMIDNPNDRYGKVLLVLGRDEADLAVAAQALVLGGDLFRGDRVVIDKVQQIQPRQPYDAPNWMRTDRAVRFAELIKYPEQLRASGLQPLPISLDINLPPDLFVWRNQGIPLQTKYRYTPPASNDGSRLNISLNNQFITSLPLVASSKDRLEELRLAVLSSESANINEKLSVPALKIGDRNNLRFNFSFATTTSSSQRDRCQTSLPVDTQAVIDDQSTIDLSGYHHYIAMPDLAAFARSGFPFSRMADLSETVVMVPPQSSAVQLSTYLEAIAGISARSGLPAINLTLSDNWEEASKRDADVLILGSLPPDLRDNQDMNVLLDRSRDWLLKANHQGPGSSQTTNAGSPVASRVEVSAKGPIAAIVGMQSPSHEQRSIVALLANEDAGFQLLRETLNDSGKMDAVAGSVVLIRSSGVQGQMVGDHYYVGSLPWWLMLWFKLSEHPILIAFLAVSGVLLSAFMTWRILKWAARRRLAYEE